MPAADAHPLVAYLVLSHRHPERVEDLARRILELGANSTVVVHHDSEDEAPWGGRPPERVHMIAPGPVRWGDWTVVAASVQLLRHGLEALGADWMVMLSGDDRPVADLAKWESELATGGFDAQVAARPITKRPIFGRRPTPDDLNYARYHYRWRVLPEAHGALGRRLEETALRVGRYAQPVYKVEYAPRRERFFLGLPRRSSPPGGAIVHCGPQWMALGREAARAVLYADPAIVAWFEETWIPDQGFFHTVLYNDPKLTLRNERLTYVPPQRFARLREDWMVLRSEDFDDIMSSGAVFARKFDPEVDAQIAKLVDTAVDRARPISEPRET